MKDIAISLAAKEETGTEKLNALREYLQALILRILYDKKYFNHLSFIGGTALRILHGLPRFSEDLDFSLVSKKNYSFEDILKKLKTELEAAGYNVVLSYKTERTVESAFVKFKDILFETSISSHREQNLSIKLEVDTNPPIGAEVVITPLMLHFPIAIKSFDMPSLFAGKCHALLSRKYTKGRDFFDLGWYLTQKPPLIPNLTLLSNSLEQTNYTGLMPDEKTWVTELETKVTTTNWQAVERDVSPFLERQGDMQVFSKQNLLNLLSMRK